MIPISHPQGDRRLGGGERVSREHAQRLHARLARHPHSTHNAFTTHPQITHKAFTTHSQSFHSRIHTNLTTSPRGARRIFSTENPRARTRKSDPTGPFPACTLHGPERGEKRSRAAEKHTNLTPQVRFQHSPFSLASRPSCRAFPGWGRMRLNPPTSNPKHVLFNDLCVYHASMLLLEFNTL